MSSFSEILWQSIVDLSQDMLENAEQGDFEALSQLNEQRDQLLKKYFESYQQQPEKIQALLIENEKIAQLILNDQQKVGQALSKLNQMKQGQTVYQQIQAQYMPETVNENEVE